MINHQKGIDMGELTRHDIMKIFRDRQDKFVYYIMGLNVAAIGFTLSKTYDIKSFNWNHLFLGFALLAWLLSIFSAFRWIQTEFSGMRLDMHQYDISAGVIDEWFEEGIAPDEFKNELIKTIQEDMAKKSARSERNYKGKLILFIVGIVMFIIWRILDITDLMK